MEDPLVVLIVSQTGMAERLLTEHAEDSWGRCRACSTGAQTGHYRWPCAIRRAAGVANRGLTSSRAVIGSLHAEKEVVSEINYLRAPDATHRSWRRTRSSMSFNDVARPRSISQLRNRSTIR
jgi:hypothetical protein